MKINDMIVEMGVHVAGNYTEDLKKKDPESFDQLTKLFNNLSQIAIQILQSDAEFRKNFAQIHAEFLKYPECHKVIEASINSYEQYVQKH